jgi:predicted dehydrogenase
MRTVKFGIIGAGLMGREFATAAARWAHLTDMKVQPEIIAVCDKNNELLKWYKNNFSSIKYTTESYNDLLSDSNVEALYIAVPHNLHSEIYTAAIKAGKHFLGEKPFGIDLEANLKILAMLKKNPEVFARCSSEFPFLPAVQRICRMIEEEKFGKIIEVNAGFLHSSDFDEKKAINWKRMIQFNGEYGCMGDLGMHVCHVPFRAGWLPKNVRALLSKLVKERPDGKGGKADCPTWDNATLACEAEDRNGYLFPMTLKTYRIAPGEKNTWKIEILGMRCSARFSTKNPKLLEIMEYKDGEQVWQHIDMGAETSFKTITGNIFELGFSDAILQMWAAFLYEFSEGKPFSKFAACVMPEETAISHKLFTAALKSHKAGTVESVM